MRPPHPGRWSLAALFVTLGIAYGIWYAYSVFLVALLREFGWSRSVLAGAFSVFALVHGGLSPALGWLADRIGGRRLILMGAVVLSLALGLVSMVNQPWQLYLTFGFLTAIGVAGAGWVPAVVLVSRWFPDRRGLALGIAGSGIGMGIFLVVPLCQVLIDWLGWRWALRALGGLALLWMVPSTLFVVRDPPEPRAPGTGIRGGGGAGAADRPHGSLLEQTLIGAMATRTFWLIGAAQVFGSFCTQSLFVHQAAYLTDQGLSALVAATVVSIVGLASILGKTGGGWLSDSLGRETVYVLGVLCMMASVGVLFLVSIAPAASTAYLYGVLLGVGYSVTAALIPAVIGDRFRGPQFGSIFGTLQVANALGGSLGPWVAGRIFDMTGSYRMALATALGSAALALAAMWSLGHRRAAGGRPRA
jgi:MFS family permease